MSWSWVFVEADVPSPRIHVRWGFDLARDSSTIRIGPLGFSPVYEEKVSDCLTVSELRYMEVASAVPLPPPGTWDVVIRGEVESAAARIVIPVSGAPRTVAHDLATPFRDRGPRHLVRWLNSDEEML